MTATTPPIEHVRLGIIQAAIWKNTSENNRSRYAITVSRIYRDADGNWQSSNSFGRDELLTLSRVCHLANSRVYELQTKDRNTESKVPATGNNNEQSKATKTPSQRQGASR